MNNITLIDDFTDINIYTIIELFIIFIIVCIIVISLNIYWKIKEKEKEN